MTVMMRIFALMCLISQSYSLQIGINKALTTNSLRQTYHTTPISREAPNLDFYIGKYLLEEIVSHRLGTFKQAHIPLLSSKKNIYGCYLNYIYDTINAYMMDQQTMNIAPNDYTNYRKVVSNTYFFFRVKQQQEVATSKILSEDEILALKDTQLLVNFFAQYYDHLNHDYLSE